MDMIVSGNNTLTKLLNNGIFAVVRMKEADKLYKIVDALLTGGINNIEITLTVPNAPESINKLKERHNTDMIVGAGTVLTLENAQKVLEAGAEFVVSPVFNREVVELCKSKQIVVAPGCYTPTEVLAAHNAGADMVKIFPATSLGPKYFKDILAVLPFVKIMPTGGVTIENVGEWVAAGASAVGIGSDLISKDIISNENYSLLIDKSKKLVNNYQEAKAKLRQEKYI